MNNRQTQIIHRPVSQGATTAKALIEAAQVESARLIASARQAAEGIRRQAEAESAAIRQRATVAQRVATIGVWRNAILSAKEDLLSVVEYLSKIVLQKDVATTPDSILNRIELASEIVDKLTLLTLELSQNEPITVRDRLKKAGYKFNIKSNFALKPGEFILSTKSSQIKSSPNFHLMSLLEELKILAPTFKQISQSVLNSEAQ